MLVLQDTRALMVGIAALQGEYGADIPVIAAAVIVAATPVIGLFIFFQRRILGGIMLGSVKGCLLVDLDIANVRRERWRLTLCIDLHLCADRPAGAGRARGNGSQIERLEAASI
jgi:hypothetical protein